MAINHSVTLSGNKGSDGGLGFNAIERNIADGRLDNNYYIRTQRYTRLCWIAYYI